MEKKIKLSEKYLMLVNVQYVKNVSREKKRYEVKSKIVNKEEYMKNKDCIGEIEGEYFTTIPVYLPRPLFLKNYYKNLLKKRVSRTINRFFLKSKKLVEEWELNEDILKATESYIEQMR